MMRSKIAAASIAGLVAGVPMGIAMHLMTAPTPSGGTMPMMAMVAQVVRSDSLAVGWLYHLFNSAVIGAFFGWWFGGRVHGAGSGLGWGAIHGLIWWVVGGLFLMPLLLGMPVFAPLTMPMMHPVALGSLLGHLMYGLVLGGVFAWLFRAPAEVPGGARPAGAR
ncbi:MAG: hypothetical protein ABIS67_04450 [Candidatus Eisenbacteria bacterium]